MKNTVVTVALAAGLLAVAGCSSTGTDTGKDSKPAPNPTAAVLKAAQDYQSAANRQDWQTVCTLSSARLRGGTVADCVSTNTVTPAASTSASPSSTVKPPTYADGSTPAPIATSTPSGPDRASDGPLTPGDVLAVPASGDHPAGYGVFLSFTVTWPGQSATTDYRALRLVQEAGGWVVDQHESNIQRADQLRSALLGG
ncbi:hypothetical protein ACFWA9_09995 [Kitasatospora sp. NPDC059973]|uniref:hypothetical protein n=1 Tax=Kitasatospora sp. NPDC059973 TaxID=3347020 RepID=UPI0036B83F4F